MKRLMFLMSALLVVGAVAYAQPAEAPKVREHKVMHAGQHMEQMRAEKIGFLTERLALTPDEAQVFWPVYNAYEKEVMEAGKVVRETRRALRPAKDAAEPTEKELKARIDDYLKALKAEAEVKAKYNAQFLKVLPAAKVAKLYLAEETFQNKMLREMYKRQAEHHGQPGMRPDGAKGPRGQKNGKKGAPADKPVTPPETVID